MRIFRGDGTFRARPWKFIPYSTGKPARKVFKFAETLVVLQVIWESIARQREHAGANSAPLALVTPKTASVSCKWTTKGITVYRACAFVAVRSSRRHLWSAVACHRFCRTERAVHPSRPLSQARGYRPIQSGSKLPATQDTFPVPSVSYHTAHKGKAAASWSAVACHRFGRAERAVPPVVRFRRPRVSANPKR